MIISIIGLGLIGGSLGLALKQNLECKILGKDSNANHQILAKDLMIIDSEASVNDIYSSDFVFLAIPVDTIVKILPGLMDNILPHTMVIDLGSTKSGICKIIENHPKRSQFIAAHPIAGTEYNGPHAALVNLFENKTMVICEKKKSDANGLNRFIDLMQLLKMKIIFRTPDDHDRQFAYISHLSHITSFALGLTVLDEEKDDSTIFDLSGSGFSSTVRLAKSSPDMWTPILLQNKDYLLDALKKYCHYISNFIHLIETENRTELQNILKQANKINQIIK